MNGSDESIQEIKRLPKGHEVKIYAPFSESRVQHLAKKGISWKGVNYKGKKCMVIDAFVSGDTPENGLSIVALDNPEYCMYHELSTDGRLNAEERITRVCVESGYDDWMTYNDGTGSPVCPY